MFSVWGLPNGKFTTISLVNWFLRSFLYENYRVKAIAILASILFTWLKSPDNLSAMAFKQSKVCATSSTELLGITEPSEFELCIWLENKPLRVFHQRKSTQKQPSMLQNHYRFQHYAKYTNLKRWCKAFFITTVSAQNERFCKTKSISDGR
jgi:hypothetical protein